jgi:predicted NBD/HSP70 family sugar kinase
MEIVYLLLSGVGAYLAADHALRAAERWRGSTFGDRQVVFLLLMTGITMAIFSLVRLFIGA